MSEPATSPLDRPLTVTVFRDFAAQAASPAQTSLRTLEKRLQETTAEAKSALPWIKLATFGETRTKNNSLRHNGNVLAIDGIEADYDAGEITVDEAAALLRQHELAAVIYTSPSHADSKPRWRVLCPTSQPLRPGERDALVARLNGALGGVLAGESFTLSQAYYFGSVKRNPAHRVVLVEGRAIDLAPELDAIARFKTVKGAASGSEVVAAVACTSMLGQEATDLSRVVGAIADIPNDGPAGWEEWNRTGMAIYAATAGTEVGRELFHGWSKGNPAYDAKATEARWQHYRTSPPTQIGAGTLFHMATEARAAGAGAVGDKDSADVGGDWRRRLQRSESGAPRPNLLNATSALVNAAEWRGRWAQNTFADVVMLREAPPWQREGETFTPRELLDSDASYTAMWLQSAGIQVRPEVALQAIKASAARNAYDPVADYLHGLNWDGVARLDTWLTRYLGAADDDFTGQVAAKSLIAAVARAMVPGCQVDTVTVLEGPQGIGKSSAIRALYGREWFTDTLPDLASKDAMVQLRGVWGIELAELATLGRSEAARIKAFISSPTDRYRKPYGSVSENVPRRCTFWGTVNPGSVGYLKDETGARRFWPVQCGVDWAAGKKVDVRELARVRDQLWAEAYSRWFFGETWWLVSRELEEAQRQVAEARFAEDVWAPVVRDYLSGKADVSMAEILDGCLRIPIGQHTTAASMRVATILKTEGWTRQRLRDANGGRAWRYVNPNVGEAGCPNLSQPLSQPIERLGQAEISINSTH